MRTMILEKYVPPVKPPATTVPQPIELRMMDREKLDHSKTTLKEAAKTPPPWQAEWERLNQLKLQFKLGQIRLNTTVYPSSIDMGEA